LNLRARLSPRTYQELRDNPALAEELRLYIETLTKIRPVKLNVGPSAIVISVDGNDLTIRISEGSIQVQAYSYAAKRDARGMEEKLRAFADELALELVKLRQAQAIRATGTVIRDRTLEDGRRVIRMEMEV
jgi:hypothetical protein